MNDAPSPGPGPSPHELPTLPPAQPVLPDAETLPPALPGLSASTDGASPDVAVNVPGYEILRELGRGGMGVVYLARQQKLNRLVALKMVLAAGHASDSDIARFLAEAEAVAQLQHPNVVPLLESGQHDGLPYFTLEYVGGGSLAERLRGTPLPPRDAAVLVAHLARGVHAAHERGIVHRDLKPANVLLTADGTPRITDFGLARRVQTAQKGLTATGAILGTPSYMAPEQAEGKGHQMGPAADIYSLGAILYECLTGRPPFQGPTPLETLTQVVSDEPVPPTRLVRAVPRDVETICLKCLQKDSARRYASAQDMAEDLERFARDEPIVARPIGRLERAMKWARRKPAVAALLAVSVIALVSLIGGGGAFTLELQAQIEETKNARAEAEAERDNAKRRLSERDRFMTQTNIFLSQAAWRENNADLANELLRRCPAENRGWEWSYFKRMYSGHHFTLYGVGSYAVFSPDGRRVIAGSLDNSVKVWDAYSGREILRIPNNFATVLSVAVSPNGKHIASGQQDSIVRLWDSFTGNPIGTLDNGAGVVLFLAYNPDGTMLATSALIPNERGEIMESRRVRLWDLKTLRMLHEWKGMDNGTAELSFSADGTLLSVSGEPKPWSTATGKPTEVATGLGDRSMAAAFSPDGSYLALGINDTIQIADLRRHRELCSLRGHTNPVITLRFSPDSRRLVSGSYDRTVRVWDVPAQREVAVFRGHSSGVQRVNVSPEGQRILATCNDGTAIIWDARMPQEALAIPFAPIHVSFDASGYHLTAMADYLNTRSWDTRTGRELSRREGPQPDRRFTAVNCPDGRLVARSFEDGTLTIREAGHDQDMFRVKGHTASVSTLCLCPTTLVLASGDEEGIVKLWNVKSEQMINELRTSTRVLCLGFSPDGEFLVTGGEEPKLWSGRNGQLLCSLGSSYMTAHCFSPVSPFLAYSVLNARGSGFDVKVWDVQERKKVALFECNEDYISSICFAPDGRRLAFTGNNSVVRIWDTPAERELLTLKTHSSNVSSLSFNPRGSLSFSPDGNQLVAVGNEGMGVWDARAVADPLRLIGHTESVSTFRFSPESAFLATGAKDKTVRIWNVKTQGLVAVCTGHGDAIRSLAFSGDGLRVASGSEDKTIRIWDAQTGRQLGILRGHDTTPSALAFSPSGRYLASDGTSPDASSVLPGKGAFKVWEISTMTEILSLKGADGAVADAAFTPDCRSLVVYHVDGTKKAWDIVTRKETPLPDVLPLPAMMSSGFSPDGRYFASNEGEIVVLRTLEPTAEELEYRQVFGKIDPSWQEQQATEAEQVRHWFAVAFHLDRVAEAGKANRATYEKRGRARAVLGQWEEALMDFTRALDGALVDERSDLWDELALAHLGAGSVAEYRKFCRRIVDQVLKVSDVPVTGLSCMTTSSCTPMQCLAPLAVLNKEMDDRVGPRTQAARYAVIGPGGIASPLELLRLAAPNDRSLRGAILLRAAKHDDAAKLLAESKEAPALLYLALAEHGRGQVAEAKQALERAKEWLKSPNAAEPKYTNETRMGWLERVETQLLRREVEALLKK